VYSEDLSLLLLFVSASFPFTAVSLMFSAAVRVQLLFRTIALIGFFELALLQTLTVSLAWSGFGALSFAIPLPIVAAVKSALLWRYTPFRPDFSKRFRWRELISSGISMLGVRICNVVVAQGDYLLLGLFASMGSVGNYFFAFNIAAQSSRTLGPSFGGTLVPTLARLRYEPQRQFNAAYQAARVLAFMAMPLCFLQASLARPVLTLLFGEKWLDSVILVQILSIALGFESISWVSNALLQAQGRFFTSFKLSIVLTALFLALVTSGAIIGEAFGAAFGVLFCYVVFTPVFTYLAFRPGKFRFVRIWLIYLVPAVLSAVAIGGSTLLANMISGISTQALLAQCAIIVSASGILYLVGLRLFVPSILNEVQHRLVALTRK
jgi:PST family polysaccharide transporter